ncbi:hypothetical protein HDU78_007337 [Chytriomyces hyalinus]|nr:hypothetical protein HDU78_007337 [Chytriomyces hyalinus]
MLGYDMNWAAFHIIKVMSFAPFGSGTGFVRLLTPDLGRDLSPDLIAMMNRSRAYIRKRVILCLYKVFLKYPEALRVAVPRLKDRLEAWVSVLNPHCVIASCSGCDASANAAMTNTVVASDCNASTPNSCVAQDVRLFVRDAAFLPRPLYQPTAKLMAYGTTTYSSSL